MAAHLYSLYEPLCGIHLLLYIQQCLLGLTTQVVFVLLILLHRVNKRLRHFQFGHLSVVQRESYRSVVLCVYYEVGRYLLHASSHHLAKRCSRARVQLAQLAEQHFGLSIIKLQVFLNLVPVLTCKRLEIVVHHAFHQVAQLRWVSAFYLQQQALLQRSGSYTSGVEGLQHKQHLFYLFLGSIYVVIDGQLVAHYVEGLAQQSVIVERANQIFHDVALFWCKIHLANLLFQLVVERFCLAIHHLLSILAVRASALINGQILVIAPYPAQCLVECRLAFFALSGRLKVVLSVRVVVIVVNLAWRIIVVIGLFALECGVIVHFGVDTVNQLRHWQFNQRRLQQLLLRERLS